MKHLDLICKIFKLFFIISFIFISFIFLSSWAKVLSGYTLIPKPSFYFLLSMFKAAIYLTVTYNLIKLFQAYEVGQYFNPCNIKYIFNIGLAMLLLQILAPVLLYINTWFIPRQLAGRIEFFSINRIEITTLACLIILNSWIMQKAYTLKSENDLTI